MTATPSVLFPLNSFGTVLWLYFRPTLHGSHQCLDQDTSSSLPHQHCSLHLLFLLFPETAAVPVFLLAAAFWALHSFSSCSAPCITDHKASFVSFSAAHWMFYKSSRHIPVGVCEVRSSGMMVSLTVHVLPSSLSPL